LFFLFYLVKEKQQEDQLISQQISRTLKFDVNEVGTESIITKQRRESMKRPQSLALPKDDNLKSQTISPNKLTGKCMSD
jgi:hypothetical protein